jgi:hypothetical protein
MKKPLLFLVLATMLWSCKRQNDILPTETLKTNNDLKKTFSGGDGVNDRLGYGIDITGDLYSIDYQSDVSIFDMDRFRNDYPYGIDKNDQGGGSSETISGATAIDILKTISTKKSAGFSGNYNWGDPNPSGDKKYGITASLSKNEEDVTTNSYSSRYSYANYEAIKQVRRLQFTSDISTDILMSYLKPQFLSDVANMSADALIAKYRTHILLGFDLGGILKYDYSGSISTTTDYSKKASDVKVGLGFSILKTLNINLNAGKSTEEINQIVNSTTDRHWKVTFYGGSGSGRAVNIDKDGNTSESLSFNTWEQSVTPYNAAIVKVVKAVFLYDFIADPYKKAQVKAAIDNYIDSKQPTQTEQPPVQGSGLPSFWASRAILLPESMSPYAIRTSNQPILSSNGTNTLYSPNRAYKLVMQGDGNLVLYNSSNVGLWNSKTNNSAPGWTYKLYYQTDGNLVIKKVSSTGAGSDIWASYTEAPYWSAGVENAYRAYMKVQDDGNVALYYNGFDNGQYSLEYSTATAGGRMSPRQGNFK